MNLHLSQPKPGAECVEPMICLNNDDKDAMNHVTELPMDGTPCDNPSSNKVIHIFHHLFYVYKIA